MSNYFPFIVGIILFTRHCNATKETTRKVAVFCTCDSGKIKRKLLGNFLPVSFLTAKKATDPDLATIAHNGKSE